MPGSRPRSLCSRGACLPWSTPSPPGHLLAAPANGRRPPSPVWRWSRHAPGRRAIKISCTLKGRHRGYHLAGRVGHTFGASCAADLHNATRARCMLTSCRFSWARAKDNPRPSAAAAAAPRPRGCQLAGRPSVIVRPLAGCNLTRSRARRLRETSAGTPSWRENKREVRTGVGGARGGLQSGHLQVITATDTHRNHCGRASERASEWAALATSNGPIGLGTIARNQAILRA